MADSDKICNVLRVFCLIFLLIPTTLFIVSSRADVCTDWFKKSKIKTGPECVTKCSILPTGMGTFDCPLGCKNLCANNASTPLSEHVVLSLLELYPALTRAEREFASKNPKDAMRGYLLSQKAEDICSSLYPVSATNDESDACRHFIWAGIMRKEFNLPTAQKILEAHEAEDLQSVEEKSMDLANNRAGLLATEELLTSKSYSEKILLEVFTEKLKSGNLIVIKKIPLPGEVK